ncbi:MAG: uroporphyrinogen-III C-methyltransferase [Pseudomonadota bacterium]|nr:uroporphyrinogen-III C-methyltransferase [Pseudomonadota bacterium]
MSGVVAIIGAGPGDPGLLTVRARELLDGAEVVVHDALVSAEILRSIPARVERVDVGKRRGKHLAEQDEINQTLVRLGREGKRVVRLKGGDPLLFGRGGEEMLALKEAGIPYIVVPGISSALAGPAMAGIPVTHRTMAAAVTIVTGHECEALVRDPLRWRAMVESGHTLVILMGLNNLEELARRLIDAGRPGDTPAAVVQEATTPRERFVHGTLADIARRVADAGIGAPATIVIGAVAGLAAELAWRT